MRRGDAKREDAAYDRGRVDALREVASGMARSETPEVATVLAGYADRIETEAKVLHGGLWPEPRIRPAEVRTRVAVPRVDVDNSPGDYS